MQVWLVPVSKATLGTMVTIRCNSAEPTLQGFSSVRMNISDWTHCGCWWNCSNGVYRYWRASCSWSWIVTISGISTRWLNMKQYQHNVALSQIDLLPIHDHTSRIDQLAICDHIHGIELLATCDHISQIDLMATQDHLYRIWPEELLADLSRP